MRTHHRILWMAAAISFVGAVGLLFTDSEPQRVIMRQTSLGAESQNTLSQTIEKSKRDDAGREDRLAALPSEPPELASEPTEQSAQEPEATATRPVRRAARRYYAAQPRADSERLFGGANTPPVAASPDAQAPAGSELAAIRAAAREQAQKAGLKIELDPEMYVDVAYDVHLAIQGVDAAGATPKLDALARGIAQPTVIAETLRLSNQVRARLSGAQFEITPVTESWQAVVPDAATVWTWRVTPRGAGTPTLFFSLEQEIRRGQQRHVIPVDNYPRAVTVKVSWAQSLSQATDWVSGNVVASLLGLSGILGGVAAVTQIWDWLNARRGRVAFAARMGGVPPVERDHDRPVS